MYRYTYMLGCCNSTVIVVSSVLSHGGASALPCDVSLLLTFCPLPPGIARLCVYCGHVCSACASASDSAPTTTPSSTLSTTYSKTGLACLSQRGITPSRCVTATLVNCQPITGLLSFAAHSMSRLLLYSNSHWLDPFKHSMLRKLWLATMPQRVLYIFTVLCVYNNVYIYIYISVCCRIFLSEVPGMQVSLREKLGPICFP